MRVAETRKKNYKAYEENQKKLLLRLNLPHGIHLPPAY